MRRVMTGALAVALLSGGWVKATSPRAPFAPRTEAKAGYTYAGVNGPDGAAGVRATVSLLEQPRVRDPGAHVAAWVGVAGKVNGKLEWLQVGISTEAAAVASGNVLYCEHQTPQGYKLEPIRTVGVGAKVTL